MSTVATTGAEEEYSIVTSELLEAVAVVVFVTVLDSPVKSSSTDGSAKSAMLIVTAEAT